MDRTVCAPYLFAGVLVECRYELLLLVVVDDHDEVVHKGRGRTRAEIKDGGKVFEWSVPDLVAVHIVGEEAKVVDVNVNVFPVSDGRFGAEAILPMAASGRPACMKFTLPVDLAGIEVQGIEKVMD